MSDTPILNTSLTREHGVTIDWALEPDGLPSVTVSSSDSSWGLFLTFDELAEIVAHGQTILLWAAQREQAARP